MSWLRTATSKALKASARSYSQPILLRAMATTTQQAQGRLNTKDEFDVVIIGGGMVGAAVCCGLATNKLTNSLRVAIIDGKPLTEGSHTLHKTSAIPDPRVSALTPSTVNFLEEVDAWKYILYSRHAPFDSMQVWDYTGLSYTRYNAADVGKHVLGYVVENNVILSALYTRIQDLGFASLICPATVKAVKGCAYSPSKLAGEENEEETRNGFAQVELDDGQRLHARLVVGADGASSKVREMAGLKSFKREYKQEALVCTLETSRSHSTAWQRFLPTGPIAILPMGATFSNIVWSTSPLQAIELKTMGEEDFVAKVNEALVDSFGPFPSSRIPQLLAGPLGSFLGVTASSCKEPFEAPPYITKCLSKRASFPLSLAHAYNYVSPRVVLVGDAAHTVHPLAGQGVNLGFGDATSLISILSAGIEVGADIGEVSLLERYEKKQKLANLPMMAVLDGFQKAFSMDFGPINAARAAAFGAAQLFSPLKRQIISYAMGESGILDSKIFQV
ncbi:hypothetical protein GOP47_0016676 [Adiantum capillus-veneris]|uniref:Ubiquinone biosynthesis monooxygenase COQ6, mitochondrial n=1 Tax=Adiantum capillus-veneris TaxID=13818 RepID=A0A9D4UI47_ADICA|nr:hypothetical protein GOP47_0016676 [Adiantum capillus-veneris]